MKRCEIRLSGAGGQGMITAGIILSEAALLEKDLNVTQTQSYGPESRGGASRAEVVLSHETIDYPKVIKPNILVALTQKAFDKYSGDIKEKGIIIVDDKINTSKNSNKTKASIFCLPIIETAENEVGLKLTSNIVVLGIVSKFVDDISVKDIKAAVRKRVPAHTVEKNMTAFEEGIKLAESLII